MCAIRALRPGSGHPQRGQSAPPAVERGAPTAPRRRGSATSSETRCMRWSRIDGPGSGAPARLSAPQSRHSAYPPNSARHSCSHRPPSHAPTFTTTAAASRHRALPSPPATVARTSRHGPGASDHADPHGQPPAPRTRTSRTARKSTTPPTASGSPPRCNGFLREQAGPVYSRKLHGRLQRSFSRRQIDRLPTQPLASRHLRRRQKLRL